MKDGNKIVTTVKDNFGGSFFEPLLELTDCPKTINHVGSLPVRDQYKFITVVGSRNCSVYAKQVLDHLMRGLAGYPVCIISGLALGVDGLAHRLSINHGITTVALPGSGLGSDVLYPASHRQLATEILESDGSIISEFDTRQGATQWTFPKRNRLMARLADLVIVIEAGEKSGTLITARNALEYNVDVGVVPNTIFAESGTGSNNLIKDGARPILSVDDILDLLGIQSSGNLERDYSELTDPEMTIIKSLIEPKSRDDLLSDTDMDVSQLSQTISLLEIKGYIKESLGKISKI